MKLFYEIPAGATDYGFLLCSNVITGAIVAHVNRCYCALTGLTGLAVKATMMLSPLIMMNFLVVYSTNLNQKKMLLQNG